VDDLTRRELLVRTGRLALAAGAVPFAGRLADLASERSAGIFDELARGLRGDLVRSGSAGYNQARLIFDTRFDSIKPRAVVFCESLADVQRTVRWARRHAVRIVPRSGGHSYGGYSTTTGVVVDVSRLNGITLDRHGHAVIGAGARLIDVYDHLAQYGRTVPAGSCPTVGIAGLALGGGVGFASRKFGLTCDNLLEATVVLADGTALVCNESSHPDLYWALRGGGGGNFGIVTRLVFRTHPVGQVATYALEWLWTDAKEVVQAWQRLAPHAPDAFFSVLNLSTAVGGRPRITSAGQFLGTVDQLRAVLKPLAETGTATRYTVSSHSYLDAQRIWAGCSGTTIAECHLPPQGHLGRSTFKGKSSYANEQLAAAGIDTMIRQIEAHPAGLVRRRRQPREEEGDRLRASRRTVLAAVPRVLGLVGWCRAEPALAGVLLRSHAPVCLAVRLPELHRPRPCELAAGLLRCQSRPSDRGQAALRPAERLPLAAEHPAQASLRGS
jgi:FAD binding domain-containing protein